MGTREGGGGTRSRRLLSSFYEFVGGCSIGYSLWLEVNVVPDPTTPLQAMGESHGGGSNCRQPALPWDEPTSISKITSETTKAKALHSSEAQERRLTCDDDDDSKSHGSQLWEQQDRAPTLRPTSPDESEPYPSSQMDSPLPRYFQSPSILRTKRKTQPQRTRWSHSSGTSTSSDASSGRFSSASTAKAARKRGSSPELSLPADGSLQEPTTATSTPKEATSRSAPRGASRRTRRSTDRNT